MRPSPLTRFLLTLALTSATFVLTTRLAQPGLLTPASVCTHGLVTALWQSVRLLLRRQTRVSRAAAILLVGLALLGATGRLLAGSQQAAMLQTVFLSTVFNYLSAVFLQE